MNYEHIDNLLESWFDGTLSEEEEEYLERHASECRKCAQLLAVAKQEFAKMARSLPPVDPSPQLRDRILSDADDIEGFEQFADQVADLVDCSRQRALRLLRSLDDEYHWEPGPLPGVELREVDAGKKRDNALVAFMRIKGGGRFPEHRHLGKEKLLVLQGGFKDNHGGHFQRGDMSVSDSDTTHDMRADKEGPPLVCLSVVEQGFDMWGQEFTAG